MTLHPLRIGSLFAGIGGLELGLEQAGIGHTVWQVEKEEYCRAVLAKHWPEAERFDDVRTVGAATLAPVDLICGGFPCTDLSPAGKRAGITGANSGLWFEYLRIVQELRPEWVVVENSGRGADAWVDHVLQGLEVEGYACLPVPLAVSDVGGPHERKRVFVIATHANPLRQHAQSEHAEMAGPQASTANTNGSGVRVEPGRFGRKSRAETRVSGLPGWRTTEPPMVRMVDELSRGLDRPTARRHALGNAVVPAVAEVIGHVIQELRS